MNLATDTKIKFHTHTHLKAFSLYIWVHYNIKSRGKMKDLVLLDFPKLIVVDLINI